MPLRWDPLLVRHLARELDAALEGAHLRALRLDRESRAAALLFREGTLLWPLHPTAGAPRLLEPTEPAPGDLPLSGRVRRVATPADERILVFEILPGRRSRSAADIRVELLGNQWNLVVTEGPDARIRHVLVRREGARTLAVGAMYAPPEAHLREGTAEPFSRERWEEILSDAPVDGRARALVRSVAWTSSLNADAFVGPEGYGLWRALAHGETPVQPVLLETPRGPQPYPWPLPGRPSTPHPSLLDAFSAWADAAAPDGAAGGTVLAPDLLAELDAVVDRALRRVTSLRAELEAAEDPATLRAAGDLLLARLGEVKPGTSDVALEDFEGRRVRLELDPRLAPHENADAYYERAARAERTRARLPRLVAQAEERAARLEELRRRALDGEASAEELRRALPDSGSGRSGHRAGGSGAPGPALPYRVYRSSGGLEIRVGRGAKHNDDLTFHHSAPQDVWLHARHTAGAHVILRWGRAESPPARDLQEAAVLAALSSRARTSGTVPVDWTFRKYVRKPRKSPPGRVAIERAQTVFVTPDPDLAERLLEDEAG